jgi:hypothetical protein
LTLSLSWISRARPLLAATALIAAIAACDESLESGLACPALCPQQAVPLKDTTLYAVEFDTSIGSYPATGLEGELLLASEPGIFDIRAIVRFDTLQTVFRHVGVVADDSEIVHIDSAFIKLRVLRSDTLGPDVTIEIYDVDRDSTGNSAVEDTAASLLLPFFTPGRLLGSRTFAAASLKDSIAVPIDGARLVGKMQGDSIQRLRIGLRATGPAPVELSVFSENGGFAPLLLIQPNVSDTTVQDIVINARSKTPTIEPLITAALADFQFVAQAPAAPPANIIRVGGAPGVRGYLRFNVPSFILDSSAVVRATLEMTQRPNPSAPSATDTQSVRPFEVAASSSVTDIRRALVFLSFGLDSSRMAPADSGVRTFEMIDALRRWRFTKPDRTPRTIALRSASEGASGWQADFYSRNAPLAVQPRLRITYIPAPKPGMP